MSKCLAIVLWCMVQTTVSKDKAAYAIFFFIPKPQTRHISKKKNGKCIARRSNGGQKIMKVL